MTSTRQSFCKRADELCVGDIIDASGLACAYGYRYHRLITAPRSNGREGVDQVVFDLSVFGHSPLELQTRAPFGWNLHIESNTPVRVMRSPPARNELLRPVRSARI